MREIVSSDIRKRIAETSESVNSDIERAMSEAHRHLESIAVDQKELDTYSKLKDTLIEDVWFRTHCLTGHRKELTSTAYLGNSLCVK